jgi:hypothetical protein
MNLSSLNYFPQELFKCHLEENTNLPLVVSPREDVNLIHWARNNQLKIAEAMGNCLISFKNIRKVGTGSKVI